MDENAEKYELKLKEMIDEKFEWLVLKNRQDFQGLLMTRMKELYLQTIGQRLGDGLYTTCIELDQDFKNFENKIF